MKRVLLLAGVLLLSEATLTEVGEEREEHALAQ